MRKHAKQRSVKQPVTRTVVSPAVLSDERVAVECEPTAEGAIAVKQDDGTFKHFIVERKVLRPAIITVKAQGPTTKHGLKNTPANMAPKGKGGAKPGPGGRK